MVFIILLAWIFLEIVLLTESIQHFGFMNVFFFWLLKTVFGIGLVKTTGIRLMQTMISGLRSGGEGLIQGAISQIMMSVSGILLVIPGFITDLIGVALFIGSFFVRLLGLDRKFKWNRSRSGMSWTTASSLDDRDFKSANEPRDVTPSDERAIDARDVVIDVDFKKDELK